MTLTLEKTDHLWSGKPGGAATIKEGQNDRSRKSTNRMITMLEVED
jgi:hypothetical protein